ncbi:DMT family transporter [Paucibacter sp. DJ1R-11]|uniref:DMT family transporter n=1 Tax=Paucibacter sp. DJ1R-11 TaxID=2893556 RepID=UPI0021E364CF|nr:DMT family transporter [Paucibacter sp. DJ1R-11]MCV2366061.1 DMT family transporter [Paucibacter sp. DJ1R-11]
MTHRKAVFLMVLVTLLWSTAGVVTRHLEAARGFELTFWRSAFNALALLLGLSWLRGAALVSQLRRAPRLVWASGLCWAVMFTAFMLALSLTTVANVLVTMALSPLLTALLARVFLHHRLPLRTWSAIVVASCGIAWMFGHEMGQGGAPGAGRAWLGIAIALGVPLASAINWSLMQHVGRQRAAADIDSGSGSVPDGADMPLAVLIGAAISALAMLPLAWPLQASWHDVGLLASLGAFQLALPCLLVVHLSRVLSGPELALLAQLEVIFGVLWAWLWAGEQPSSAAMIGGGLVLAALIGNELLAWREQAARGPASPSNRLTSSSRRQA